MTAFPVPRYLAETARRHGEVAAWLAGLPSIVAELADRWSLRVGEPFQPGGQCSWTAPATGPDQAGLVLKVGFRLAGRMAGLAGIDGDRVRQWLFARSVQESVGWPLMRQVAAHLAPA